LSPDRASKFGGRNGVMGKSPRYMNNNLSASPLTSCISSFYEERIADLLPEKQLVTKKLFKNQMNKG
jgi:hypothetical protein